MEQIAHKSHASYYLNLIIIAVIFLTAIFLFQIQFLRIIEMSTIIFLLVISAFLISPIKEILNSRKRKEIIIYKKGNQISITNIKNETVKIIDTQIRLVKKYKVPFINFGTLIIYTDFNKFSISI